MRFEQIIIIGTVLVLCSLASAMGPDTLWISTFGGDDSACGSSLQLTTDGGFIMAGITCSFTAYAEAYYLVKADSSGNLEWETDFAGKYILDYPSVVQTTDGGYLLAGSDGDMPFSCIYAVKTDQTGALEWREHYSANMLLLKIDIHQEGFAIEDNLNDQCCPSILSCNPNPCRGFAEISYQAAESLPTSISICDLRGHLVGSLGTTTQSGNFSMSWNGDDDYGQSLPGSIYTVVARSGLLLDSRRIILIN